MPALLSMTGTPHEILQALDALGQHDTAVAKMAARWRAIAIFWFIAAGLSLIAAIVMGHDYFDYPPGLYIRLCVAAVFLVCLVIGALFWRLRVQEEHEDVDDDKLTVSSAFFSQIGQVIPDTERFTVEISFASYELHGEIIDEMPADPKCHLYRHVTFLDPWFSAKGRLADWRDFEVVIKQHIELKIIDVSLVGMNIAVMTGESLRRMGTLERVPLETMQEAAIITLSDVHSPPAADALAPLLDTFSNVVVTGDDHTLTITGVCDPRQFSDVTLDPDEIHDSLEEMDLWQQMVNPPKEDRDEDKLSECFVTAEALVQLVTCARDAISAPAAAGIVPEA